MALLSAAALGAVWIALHPLPAALPEAPEPRPSLPVLEERATEGPPPPPRTEGRAATGPAAHAPAPGAVPSADPRAPLPDLGGGRVAALPEDAELARTLERQLAMNGLEGLRVDVGPDRVVTSGRLADPADRQRLALIVRALAPGRRHDDRTTTR